MAVAIVVGDDSLPRTTSSSFITFAGEKKCMPMTLSGRFVADAISSTSRCEVFYASTAPSLQMPSSSANTDFFSSMSSSGMMREITPLLP